MGALPSFFQPMDDCLAPGAGLVPYQFDSAEELGEREATESLLCEDGGSAVDWLDKLILRVRKNAPAS